MIEEVLTRTCWECGVVSSIYNAVSIIAGLIYIKLKLILIPIVALFFGFWILWYFLLKLRDEKSSIIDTLKENGLQLIKIVIVIAALLMNAQTLFSYTVEPILNLSTWFGKAVIETTEERNLADVRVEYNQEEESRSILSPVSEELANQRVFPQTMKQAFIDITMTVGKITYYGVFLAWSIFKLASIEFVKMLILQAIGWVIARVIEFAAGSVTGGAGAVLVRIVVNVVEKGSEYFSKVSRKMYIGIMLAALGLLGTFFLIGYYFLLNLINSIITIGIAAALTPFAIASWAFSYFKGKLLSPIFNMFVSSFVNIAMLCIITSMIYFIFDNILNMQYDMTFIGNAKYSTIKQFLDGFISQSTSDQFTSIQGDDILKILWNNIDIGLIMIIFGVISMILLKKAPDYAGAFISKVDTSIYDQLFKVNNMYYDKAKGVSKNAVKYTKPVAQKGIKEGKDYLKSKITGKPRYTDQDDFPPPNKTSVHRKVDIGLALLKEHEELAKEEKKYKSSFMYNNKETDIVISKATKDVLKKYNKKDLTDFSSIDRKKVIQEIAHQTQSYNHLAYRTQLGEKIFASSEYATLNQNQKQELQKIFKLNASTIASGLSQGKLIDIEKEINVINKVSDPYLRSVVSKAQQDLDKTSNSDFMDYAVNKYNQNRPDSHPTYTGNFMDQDQYFHEEDEKLLSPYSSDYRLEYEKERFSSAHIQDLIEKRVDLQETIHSYFDKRTITQKDILLSVKDEKLSVLNFIIESGRSVGGPAPVVLLMKRYAKKIKREKEEIEDMNKVEVKGMFDLDTIKEDREKFLKTRGVKTVLYDMGLLRDYKKSLTRMDELR